MKLNLDLPSGMRLISLADAPEQRDPVARHNGAVWPAFMLQDPVADRLWHHLEEEFAEYQLILLDEADVIVAASNSAPLAWDGTLGDLPAGWDDQFERTVAGLRDRVQPNTLGALQIVVAPGRQRSGLSRLMLQGFLEMARQRGFGQVIACVRPNQKHRYPLLSMEDYIAWTRPDGLPADAWLRVHARAGGEIVGVAPDSMVITGSITQWREWTGLEFPVSGRYVLDGALEPAVIDREADRGEYHDANVWVIHRV